MVKINSYHRSSKLVKQSFGWMYQGIDEVEFFRRWKLLLQQHKERCKGYRKKYQCGDKWRKYHREHMAKYRAINPEKYRIQLRKSYVLHAEKRRADARAQRQAIKLDPEKFRVHKFKVWTRRKHREQTDNDYLLRRRIRGRIRQAIAKEYRNGSALRLLGCTIPEFRAHIESLWIPGMSWDNYGLNGWEIDHKRACATFDLTDPEQQSECFHYSNTQPLWAKDNRSKGHK